MPAPEPPRGNLLADLVKAALLLNLTKCADCGRPNPGNPHAVGWIVKVIPLVTIPLATKCPDCQTVEERIDCAIQESIGTQYHFDGFRILPIEPPETEAS